MKIALLVSELHYFKLMWGKHHGAGLLCDVNPQSCLSNENIKMSSFKSSEYIQKKEGGPNLYLNSRIKE